MLAIHAIILFLREDGGHIRILTMPLLELCEGQFLRVRPACPGKRR